MRSVVEENQLSKRTQHRSHTGIKCAHRPQQRRPGIVNPHAPRAPGPHRPKTRIIPQPSQRTINLPAHRPNDPLSLFHDNRPYSRQHHQAPPPSVSATKQRAPTESADAQRGAGGAGGEAPARGKRSAAAQTTKATRSPFSGDTSRLSTSWS
ncbi:hypothetical protein GCM10009745_08500 [Kribbella yunnanensis]|uniref:Uncharacterized protein n=1 Tax=Kribbella yunnanensis TaxID=190194 RepID=A0ABP4S9W7_9ACTN